MRRAGLLSVGHSSREDAEARACEPASSTALFDPNQGLLSGAARAMRMRTRGQPSLRSALHPEGLAAGLVQ